MNIPFIFQTSQSSYFILVSLALHLGARQHPSLFQLAHDPSFCTMSQRLTQPFGNLNMSDNNDPVIRSINNTKAEYRRLGKSGLRVSLPILGAMSFGKLVQKTPFLKRQITWVDNSETRADFQSGHKDWQPWVIEEDEALPLLKAAYDRGLNTWDTANVSRPNTDTQTQTARPRILTIQPRSTATASPKRSSAKRSRSSASRATNSSSSANATATWAKSLQCAA